MSSPAMPVSSPGRLGSSRCQCVAVIIMIWSGRLYKCHAPATRSMDFSQPPRWFMASPRPHPLRNPRTRRPRPPIGPRLGNCRISREYGRFPWVAAALAEGDGALPEPLVLLVLPPAEPRAVGEPWLRRPRSLPNTRPKQRNWRAHLQQDPRIIRRPIVCRPACPAS
jgi:hypothetical protein